MSDNKTDIFISYRREDGEEFARRLADELTSLGYDVFFDRQSLQIGCVFPNEIQNAIESCSEFISVCSPAYLGENSQGQRRICQEDDWVAREIEIALSRDIHIFPINTSSLPPPQKEHLPPRLHRLLDYNFCSVGKDEDLAELLDSIVPLFTAQTRERKERTVLINRLKEIGDGENSADFNVHVRSLVIQMSEADIRRYLYPLITADDCDESLHFTAFYAVYTFYRRYSSHHIIEALVNDFCARFEKFRFNNIVLSQFYRFRFEDATHDSDDLNRAIIHAELGVDTIQDNYGVLLNYAELIAIGLENGLMKWKKELPHAIKCMGMAMEMKGDYPKLYAILGRLLSFNGKVNEALLHINKAIDLEDTQKKDAFLRINQYQSYITDIKIRQAKDQNKRLIILSSAIIGVLLVVSVILSLISIFLN